MVVGIAKLRPEDGGERGPPFVVLGGVLRPPRGAAHNERVAIRGERRRRPPGNAYTRDRTDTKTQVAESCGAHRRPQRRRRIHSAARTAITSAKVHGACQRS